MSVKLIAIGLVLFSLILVGGCRAPAAPTIAAVATATGAATSSIEATDAATPSKATPTVIPSAVASATLQPSPIPAPPSPTPPPLQVHEWLAGPVLLRYDIDCPDFCGGETFSHYPRLILYNDGRLVTTTNEQGRTLLEESRLTGEQVCTLLNSFDATGLFDHDPSAFYEANNAFPRLTLPAQASITAWDEAAIPLGPMADYRPGGELGGRVALDAPLLLAFHLMERLTELRGEAPYVPSELAVSVFTVAPDDDPFSCCFAAEGGPWPATAVRLADLVAQGVATEDDPREVLTTVSGPAVEPLLAAFGDDPFSETRPVAFEEDGQRYVVAIRALLPYESLASLGYPLHSSIIPGPDVVVTPTPLSCAPEDGVVDFYADVVAAAEADAARLSGFPRPSPAPITPPPPSPKDEFEP